MSTLTDNDLQAVAEARQLADAPYPADADGTAQELRRAKILLAYLAGIIEQAERIGGDDPLFTIGQLVTVTDGGWTGTVERIDADLGAAYVRFPDRPDLVPYAFEALGQAS